VLPSHSCGGTLQSLYLKTVVHLNADVCMDSSMTENLSHTAFDRWNVVQHDMYLKTTSLVVTLYMSLVLVVMVQRGSCPL